MEDIDGGPYRREEEGGEERGVRSTVPEPGVSNGGSPAGALDLGARLPLELDPAADGDEELEPPKLGNESELLGLGIGSREFEGPESIVVTSEGGASRLAGEPIIVDDDDDEGEQVGQLADGCPKIGRIEVRLFRHPLTFRTMSAESPRMIKYRPGGVPGRASLDDATMSTSRLQKVKLPIHRAHHVGSRPQFVSFLISLKSTL